MSEGRQSVAHNELEMPPQLFFVNVPHNCSDRELKEWMESRGVEAGSIRIIRDLVAGVSPAFAYAALKDQSQLETAVTVLNGKKIRNQTVRVTLSVGRRCFTQG